MSRFLQSSFPSGCMAYQKTNNNPLDSVPNSSKTQNSEFFSPSIHHLKAPFSTELLTCEKVRIDPAPVNYGHSQAPVYGQPTPYAQSGPTQQSYGHGYNDPKYDNQAPSQQFYGQQPISSQPGVYGQQAAPQPSYGQQQNYNKPPYGAPTQEMPPSYGPPRASQPGEPVYQGPAPSSYGSGAATQQTYPYVETRCH